MVLSSLEAEHAGLALVLPTRLALPLSCNTFREFRRNISVGWLRSRNNKLVDSYTDRSA